MSEFKPLRRCPVCGRPPTLEETWYSEGRYPLIKYRYVCRTWFGFVKHLLGPYAWIEKGWSDLGVKEAKRKWNALVPD